MRVLLKGVNQVSKRLASGERVTYYYAWKGGPRLLGRPGDPEFISSYQALVATKLEKSEDTFQTIINAYQASPNFKNLAPRTRKDYIRNIRKIEEKFSEFPLEALNDQRTRAELLGWRDRLATKSLRQADYIFATLAAIMAWAVDRGMIGSNPCVRPGKLYGSTRADAIWLMQDEAALKAVAPPHLWLAFLLAVWTGQRQGDLLKLTWSNYDGSHIRLEQSKGHRRVVIPVSIELKAALDLAASERSTTTILSTTDNTTFTSDGFRTSWGKLVKKAKITGLTFHDIRGTAVTRFALGGCSNAEIATFTGHSLKDVAAILDAHYLGRSGELAESALAKREAHESRARIPNQAPNYPKQVQSKAL
jgi:integrase